MISGWMDKKEGQGGEREGGREKREWVRKKGNRSNYGSLPLSLSPGPWARTTARNRGRTAQAATAACMEEQVSCSKAWLLNRAKGRKPQLKRLHLNAWPRSLM